MIWLLIVPAVVLAIVVVGVVVNLFAVRRRALRDVQQPGEAPGGDGCEPVPPPAEPDPEEAAREAFDRDAGAV